MLRTMTVKGKGYASAPPDTAEINMELIATRDTYDRAMKDAARKLELLREALKPHGFDKQDIKTLSFHVDAYYEYHRDAAGAEKRQFMGYRYQHRLRIEFPMDSPRLAKILTHLAESAADPELSVHFKLKDRKTVEEALLEDAILDATQKARLLATASQVALGSILSITYDWKEIELYAQPVYESARMLMEPAAAGMDMEPQDIENSDTVTVVWELAPEKP